MISGIDGVSARVLRMVPVKYGKEVSLLLWINVYSFIHKILIFCAIMMSTILQVAILVDKNSSEVFGKLKCRWFRAKSFLTCLLHHHII